MDCLDMGGIAEEHGEGGTEGGQGAAQTGAPPELGGSDAAKLRHLFGWFSSRGTGSVMSQPKWATFVQVRGCGEWL
jgi:hypothetical protein